MSVLISKEVDTKTQDGKKTGYKFKLEVLLNSTDVGNNKWNVTINHYSYGYNNKWYYNTTGPTDELSTTIDGTNTTRATANVKGIQKDSYQLLASATFDIYANNDGTKTVTFAAKYTNPKTAYYGETTSGYMPPTNTVSEIINMPTIPRASSFSYSGTTLGSTTSISINRASSSFTHTVVYTMGNVSQSYTGIGTSTSFTRPYTDAQQFGAYSASGIGTITVITYNGGTEIGRSSQNITMSLPDNNDTKPVANSSTAITEAVSGIDTKFGAFIQNNSQALFTFNYSGRYGANISEYSVSIGGDIKTSNNNAITTNKLIESGSLAYTCKIKDTRGRITTETGVIQVLPYNKPQISANIERASTGQSATVNVIASITSLNNLNDKSVVIKYKSHSSTTYYSQTVSFDSGSYTMNKTVSIPISESLSYDFYVGAIDYFSEEDTAIIPISTVFDLMHFGNDGESIAIGKRVEINGAFEVGLDMYYKGQTLEDYIRSVINGNGGNN